MNKKKIIILCSFILIIIVLGVIFWGNNSNKVSISQDVEYFKANFPNMEYIESVNIECESRDGILPSPDGPVYRGYIYLSEEGKEYYSEKYKWNNAEAKCNLVKLSKSDFNENTWMASSKFVEDCIPKFFWGDFYFSGKGVFYFEFSGY